MDHIIKATKEDELGMDFIRTTKDGDRDNDTLCQRVMQGNFTMWNSMAKVARDRGEAGQIFDKLQKADQKTKDDVVAILDAAAKPIDVKPIEEEVIK